MHSEDDGRDRPFVFPKWLDALRPVVAVGLAVAPLFAIALVWFGGSPRTTDVGYAPEQPVPYSHALHAGELGIDCRYCHTGVDRQAHATIPPTDTCMGCHANIKADSELLAPVRESHAEGTPIPWVRVHDLGDYAYFDHSAHVTRGVSCVSCHGRVDRMEVVRQVEPLSMGWCLDCHRFPDPHLRDPALVTDLAWEPQGSAEAFGARIAEARGVAPSEDCSTCHR